MTDTHTEYATLGVALDGLGSAMTVSELHGGFCGVLCAGGIGAASIWLEDFVRESETRAGSADEAREIFRVMELETWRVLASSDLEFVPLLPEDDLSLDDRVSELALWCHGFLAGLGLGGLSLAEISARRSGDEDSETDVGVSLEEILDDFAAISRAGLSAVERGDPTDSDFALTEIVEHVRVSVQIVFEEIAECRGSEVGVPTSMLDH